MRLDVLNDAERELAAESFLFRGIPPEELMNRLFLRSLKKEF